jgi:hypothetical protein
MAEIEQKPHPAKPGAAFLFREEYPVSFKENLNFERIVR